ncbi:hypothetical protein [Novosphingobium sp.]|uniref:COG4705 family protein n=1 Tax=Novosphingobium sp. TaxID=1874826 RepID=UPI003B5302DC
MDATERDAITKVPALTLGFWIIKILATTLGETGGDAVSMSWLGETTPGAAQSPINGYLVGSLIFFAVLAALVFFQVRARRFHPWLYWGTIIASTTAGTTLADFADRSLGIGYAGGAIILAVCVLLSLYVWYRTLGTVSVNSIVGRRQEVFYWVTITFSQTLGTALGDWVADSGPGYAGGALLFGAAIAVIAALYVWTRVSHVLLFWAAFILTRPLGATVGDFLDKPIAKGGLSFSRPLASVALTAAIVLLIVLVPQRAARQAH